MQPEDLHPERVVLTSLLGSRCGSQGHREAVTKDMCSAGSLALWSLPGALCISPSRAPGSTCDWKDTGGSSLCVSSARASPWRSAQSHLGWGFWDMEPLAFLYDAQALEEGVAMKQLRTEGLL